MEDLKLDDELVPSGPGAAGSKSSLGSSSVSRLLMAREMGFVGRHPGALVFKTGLRTRPITNSSANAENESRGRPQTPSYSSLAASRARPNRARLPYAGRKRDLYVTIKDGSDDEDSDLDHEVEVGTDRRWEQQHDRTKPVSNREDLLNSSGADEVS